MDGILIATVLLLCNCCSNQCDGAKPSVEVEYPLSSLFLCEGCLAATEFANARSGALKWRTEVVVSNVLDNPNTICAAINFEDGASQVAEGREVIGFYLSFSHNREKF